MFASGISFQKNQIREAIPNRMTPFYPISLKLFTLPNFSSTSLVVFKFTQKFRYRNWDKHSFEWNDDYYDLHRMFDSGWKSSTNIYQKQARSSDFDYRTAKCQTRELYERQERGINLKFLVVSLYVPETRDVGNYFTFMWLGI